MGLGRVRVRVRVRVRDRASVRVRVRVNGKKIELILTTTRIQGVIDVTEMRMD